MAVFQAYAFSRTPGSSAERKPKGSNQRTSATKPPRRGPALQKPLIFQAGPVPSFSYFCYTMLDIQCQNDQPTGNRTPEPTNRRINHHQTAAPNPQVPGTFIPPENSFCSSWLVAPYLRITSITGISTSGFTTGRMKDGSTSLRGKPETLSGTLTLISEASCRNCAYFTLSENLIGSDLIG